MPSTSFSLQTDRGLLADIQIWSDAATEQPNVDPHLDFVCVAYHERIPLFLVSNGPFDVYSEHVETENYFYESLVCLSEAVGILAKSLLEGTDTYFVFYLDQKALPRVRCYYIDFSVRQQVAEFREKASKIGDQDVFFISKTLGSAGRSDTSVFDRVLGTKASKIPGPVSAPQPPVAGTLALTTSQQISQAVSRVVLSGLRLRGLSTNPQSSANDKLAIREIYHMTNKAANFALRKYSYEFNERARQAPPADHVGGHPGHSGGVARDLCRRG
ncbi:hypothetical protein METBIDRAFT_228880, partial [Metschnikowia bicuspidata var. bicuspidata NRRL YB-4993]